MQLDARPSEFISRRLEMNTLNPITKNALATAKAIGEIRLGSWGVELFIKRPTGEISVKPDARGIITLARVRAALRSKNV